MIALPPWVQEGGVDATVERLHDAGCSRPAPIGMVCRRDPLCTRKRRDRDGCEPRLAMGRRADGRRGRPASGARPRRLRLRDSGGVGHGGRDHGVPPGRANRSRRSCDTTSPCSHGGVRRNLLRRLSPPAGWGAFARYLGYHTRELGDYSWPEAVTHLSTHAARQVSADRPRIDPSGLCRRYRGAGSRRRSSTSRPTQPVAPWPTASTTCWSTGRSCWKTANRPGRRRAVLCGEDASQMLEAS